MEQDNNTFIRLKKTTRDKLKALRLVDRESYDSVINRIIKEKE